MTSDRRTLRGPVGSKRRLGASLVIGVIGLPFECGWRRMAFDSIGAKRGRGSARMSRRVVSDAVGPGFAGKAEKAAWFDRGRAAAAGVVWGQIGTEAIGMVDEWHLRKRVPVDVTKFESSIPVCAAGESVAAASSDADGRWDFACGGGAGV